MIVEFTGLPKSGKSSTIAAIRDFFSRSGYRTKLVTEGARTCPFSNKQRTEFACWTANRAMNSVLEAKLGHEQDSIILQDRGLFDAMAFIKLLALEKFISETKSGRMLEYFSDQRWTQYIDFVFLLEVSPAIAIDRDLAARLKAPAGVITNLPTMKKLAIAYEFVLERYGDRFPRIVRLDTTNTSQFDIVGTIIQSVLENTAVEAWN
jgi:thymidylate kinase